MIDCLTTQIYIYRWGDYAELLGDYTYINNELFDFKVKRVENENLVDVVIKDKILFSFVDCVTNEPYTFSRRIGNKTFNYVEGVKIYTEQDIKTNFITKKYRDLGIKDSFIIMDL